MKELKINAPFPLEGGAVLPELTIAYTTYGQLSESQDNVIWICHALTANADPAEWWPGLVGEGKLFDPAKHFIVCANMIGSCYGSSGPASVDPASGKPYRQHFPQVTIRDMVRGHQLLQAHLGINRIELAIGGSMGGQQVLEWAITDPGLFRHIVILAANARHSPWGIAFNEAQRMAIEADPSLGNDSPEAGLRGLEAARAIAMLSYRNYETYQHAQTEPDDEKLDGYRASSYQRYQGLKLRKRFDVYAYLTLSKAMDSHHVGRGRASLEAALQTIRAKTLVIGIGSDILFPVSEQAEIASLVPNGRLEIIESIYGHDGFLIEDEQITQLVKAFQQGKAGKKKKGSYRLNGKGFIKKAALPGTEGF